MRGDPELALCSALNLNIPFHPLFLNVLYVAISGPSLLLGD